MSFKDIEKQIKKTYNSAYDNIVEDFYNIILSEAIKYDRISGFFSSTSLAIAARGMEYFIRNNGHMRLLCGSKLSENDLEVITNSTEYKDYISKKFIEDLNNIEDELINNRVKMLGWMISNDYLEIKIGLNIKNNTQDSMLHIKKGILYDSNNDSISFEGSVNETAYGWYNNIESFKVFNSWNTYDYLYEDIKVFDDFWNNNNDSLEVIDVPEACKEKLISIAPKNEKEFNDLITTIKSKKPAFRDYQNKAINAWFNNDYKGILAMATGTGKTFTALGCYDKLKKNTNKLVTIIVCPSNHLLTQWKQNIENFGIKSDILIISKDNKKKFQQLRMYINDIESDIISDFIILITFNTFSRKDFQDIIIKYHDKTMLIIDEVHGIGAPEFRKGLLELYTYRLGLSATPEIEDDFERNEIVYNYFGNIIYEYDLKKAIDNGFLTPYYYYPNFVDLNEDEFKSYKEYSIKIANLLNSKNINEKNLTKLLNQRIAIVNKANNKYKKLIEILDNINDIRDLIIYCADKKQKNKVEKILKEKKIHFKQFTGDESTLEREQILEHFASGHYPILTSMKCLDEGVDVPSTKIAILMSSTLNTRQHVQRRGRILRKYKNKKYAKIYDLIVFPKIDNNSSLRNIIKNELKRYDEYALLAKNNAYCSKLIMKKWEEIHD